MAFLALYSYCYKIRVFLKIGVYYTHGICKSQMHTLINFHNCAISSQTKKWSVTSHLGALLGSLPITATKLPTRITTVLILTPWISVCFEPYVSGTTQNVPFCVWLLWLSVMLVTSIHVVACRDSWFIPIAVWYSNFWQVHKLFIHSIASSLGLSWRVQL